MITNPSNVDEVEKYYSELKGLFLSQIDGQSMNGLYLDLNDLPIEPHDFKKVLIKWLIQVNMPRLKGGFQPIVTLQLVLQCPIWKIIKPPLKTIKLTREGMFGKPSIKLGKKQTKRSI